MFVLLSGAPGYEKKHQPGPYPRRRGGHSGSYPTRKLTNQISIVLSARSAQPARNDASEACIANNHHRVEEEKYIAAPMLFC